MKELSVNKFYLTNNLKVQLTGPSSSVNIEIININIEIDILNIDIVNVNIDIVNTKIDILNS